MKINELIHQFDKLKMNNKKYKTKSKKCKISKLHKIGIHLFKGKNIGFSKYSAFKSICIELIKQYNKFYELNKNDCIYEMNFKIKKKLNNECIENFNIII
jgi:hypothetical protein